MSGSIASTRSVPLIGFVGQGWIGRHYADDFEARGFKTVRYALEVPYRENKKKIALCDVVLIAVPTPTTPAGFSAEIVDEALSLVGAGKIAVIKSTILPGTTKELQKKYLKLTVLYAPEFLSESTAAYDVTHPFSNIVGIPEESKRHRDAATLFLTLLTPAPSSLICSSTEAEIIKYTHNASGYVQIILFNLMYDLARKFGCDWSAIHRAILADPLICNRYAQPEHKSGRGAGGGCFIKDIAALRELYQKMLPADRKGIEALEAFERKNIDLLLSSNKDVALLRGVYGTVDGI